MTTRWCGFECCTGQWIADFHGTSPVFPRPRAGTTLDTIRRINCALSQSGATNYASPDGEPVECGGYGTFSYFPPELYMLAMTYMYHDSTGGSNVDEVDDTSASTPMEYRSFGVSLLKRSLDNQVLKWGYGWDAPNIYRGDADTGERSYGADYYQDMMLWAVPAALAGQDITGPMQAGGLVHNILSADADDKLSAEATRQAAADSVVSVKLLPDVANRLPGRRVQLLRSTSLVELCEALSVPGEGQLEWWHSDEVRWKGLNSEVALHVALRQHSGALLKLRLAPDNASYK